MATNPEVNEGTTEIVNAAGDNRLPLDQWREILRRADVESLCGAAGYIWGTGETGERKKARRDSVIAALQARLVEQQVRTMVDLNRAATALTWVSIGVAVVGVVAGIVLPLMG